MGTTATDQATTSTGAPAEGAVRSTRDRILDAALDLFYTQGIRAVSADRIIERAGITKVTFYRHFRTKDALVVAYLERQGAWERGALDGIRETASDDAEAFRLFAHGIGTESCRPGFRGCPFLNAAAEYSDPESPARRLIAEQRAWYRETFAGMLGRMGATDPEDAADEVMMLRDGAMMAGYLDESSRVGRALAAAIFAVANAHGAAASK